MTKEKVINKTQNKGTYENKINENKQSGLHDGHRDRVRNKIRQYGIESLEEHEVLEYILFHFIPRKDVNPLAHNLINEFGSLYNVLSAELSRLEKVPSLTKNAALFLSSFTSIYDIALISREKESVYLYNIRDMINYAAPRIANASYEKLLIVLLDINNKVIGEKIFTNKNNKSVVIKRQQIITSATDVHADKVIMAHNHPSGDFYPSDADIEEANNVREALAYIGINFVDSLILTHKKATSINLTSNLRADCRPYFQVKGKKQWDEDSEVKEDNSEQNEGEANESVENSQTSTLPEIDIETVDETWLKEKGIFNIN